MRFALALSLMTVLLREAPALADEMLIDGIAAQVGTDIVLISEVMELVAPQESAMRAQNAPQQQIAQARADALETMIEWRLIEQMVQRTELFAADAEIDTTIEAIASDNNLTLAQLQRNVTTQGMLWDAYRAEIKRELERRKILSAVIATKVQIEDSEVEARFASQFKDQRNAGTSVHLRQILTVGGEAGSGASVEEACDFVREARGLIKSGRDFAELATRYSAVAADTGGDLGWMHSDELSSYMRNLVEPLEPGQLSEVHELPIGCTLVQLVERREFEPVTYEQAEERLRGQLYEEKLKVEYRSWMETLRSQTFIERRGYFADAAQFEPEQPESSDFEAGLVGAPVLTGGGGGAESTQ
jgi:peptidyl-prolyl cis-trans isomerase SurA